MTIAYKNLSSGHEDKIDIVRKTHANYCGIKKKEIALLAGGHPGTTDVFSYVKVPFEDDSVDLVHKHEWQHIFFLTDLPLRGAFVDEFAKKFVVEEKLRDMFSVVLHDYTNCLDDIRVSDLWMPLYPTSGRAIHARWAELVNKSLVYPTDIVHYTIGVGIGALDETSRSQWKPWFSLIKGEAERLRGAPFIQVLISAKKILETIFQDVAKNYSFIKSPRSGIAHRLGKRLVGTIKTLSQQEEDRIKLVNLLVETGGVLLQRERFSDLQQSIQNTFSQDILKKVSAVMGLSPDLTEIVREERAKLTVAIQSLRPQRKKEPSQKDKWPDLVVYNVPPTDVQPVELSIEERALANRLKHKFSVLYGRKVDTLTEEGADLDVPAFMEMRFSNDPAIYRDKKYVRGFAAILLVDMSGSMFEAWTSVAKAAKILSTAMDIPNTEFEVWGFTGSDTTDVLYRFDDPSHGYEFVPGKYPVTWGLTPLHVVTDVAVSTLAMSRLKERHLIIVTDGLPVARRGSLKTHDVIGLVSRTVAEARRRHIETSPLILGKDISLPALESMFGGRGWTPVTEEGLLPSLVALLQNKISTSLRRRF